ncbi:XdhC family protein [Caulobacter sp. S45]|uniref:XdhC family protein n=1 Tax=Caulobacter sp. S45 TaxID=1641861 RepID=UPI001575D118|nr:XdhC family protein [Caulobacter sp. S45]
MTALADWPIFGWADDVRPALADMAACGASGVLATLYKVVGGSPRPAGSQMLITEGRLHGYLSGGCIEGDIAAHAEDVLASGRPQRLAYGEGAAFADIRLVCGGRVDILLEPLLVGDAAVAALLKAYAARTPCLWASDGLDRICVPPDAVRGLTGWGPAASAFAGLAAHPDVLCVNVSEGAAVGRRYEPAGRLIVVGQDPTALAIASLASQSGFDTHLLRPKGPTTPPPLPGVVYHRGAVVEALEAIGLDPWTYVAVATHALEEDEAALLTALPSPAAYVGVLGAQRRLPERLARLRGHGVTPDVLERLHAPIGLDLGGKAPFEIAIAVLAEIMAEANLRRPKAAIDCARSGTRAA